MSLVLNNSITNRWVISLGGSLIAPGAEPDWRYLKSFREIIFRKIEEGNSFYIIVGGGNPARVYQAALKALGSDDKTLDHMGIFTTHMNAYYVSLAFGLPPEHKVVLKVDRLKGDSNLHITGAGLKPGQSTDTVAIQAAIQIGAQSVINLSNINHVYSADPTADPTAQKLETLTWREYLDIIPNEWRPGLSTPFDPIGARLAMDNDIRVTVLGQDLKNLTDYLEGSTFTGSEITN